MGDLFPLSNELLTFYVKVELELYINQNVTIVRITIGFYRQNYVTPNLPCNLFNTLWMKNSDDLSLKLFRETCSDSPRI